MLCDSACFGSWKIALSGPKGVYYKRTYKLKRKRRLQKRKGTLLPNEDVPVDYSGKLHFHPPRVGIEGCS